MKHRHRIEIAYTKLVTSEIFEGAKTVAEVEGKLKIIIGDRLFFCENHILLLELAIFFSNWLENIERGIIINFYYESMDYEDRSILKFFNLKHNRWHLYSVWQEFSYTETIDLKELKRAVEKYVFDLKRDLEINHNLAVENLFLN